ncbi:hypothetical protein [Hyphomicrobium sp.]|uniref:hypothetical protein n=1 Tax=Hyphomicrobium sp. TaxID=82 RepID=UPI001E05E639|nr:hypothetical protein [Hyphomicrobium sp.]MBY0559520.1 hypothetical protein [Hyphomicrobium sp.]
MRNLILSALLMTSLAVAPAAFAQNADDNDDAAPVDAPYYSDEQYGTPSEAEPDEIAIAPDSYGIDVSGEGAGSGESGFSEEYYEVAPPGAPLTEE